MRQTKKTGGLITTLCSIVRKFSIGLLFLVTSLATAQDYPNKPVRIVTGLSGAGTDIVSRLIAQGISGPLNQQVIVDNRGALVAPETVSKATPDGYTLLVDSESLPIIPLLQKVPYDPEKELTGISVLMGSPLMLVVHPSLPVKSVKELIALAKARPGELNYASGPVGGSGHRVGELFKMMAGGLKIVHVPYKGSIAAYPDLMSGEVQMLFEPPTSVMPFIQVGKLRGLAVTSLQPTKLVPSYPTVAATLPGFEVLTSTSMYAPLNTPPAVINRLNQEVVRLLKTPEAQEKLFKLGTDVIASSPAETNAAMKGEIAKWSKVIREAGIKVQQ